MNSTTKTMIDRLNALRTAYAREGIGAELQHGDTHYRLLAASPDRLFKRRQLVAYEFSSDPANLHGNGAVRSCFMAHARRPFTNDLVWDVTRGWDEDTRWGTVTDADPIAHRGEDVAAARVFVQWDDSDLEGVVPLDLLGVATADQREAAEVSA